ncbi:hypothetical protein B9Z55_012100 [Caenorhabditis nigoni]|uniref:F-box domain-containing protein n=1 Tax=Caenorhabditis nigoni TaxID=1611254 RepID=A0A2G5TVU4_9PELO|nr:hypothetical protein B9Z55_012100 [Caenorhabditis nigoni]
MPFPILRTPFVVLSEIFCLLEPNETVTTSFCSKNIKRLLRNHYRQRKPLMWETHMREHENDRMVAIAKYRSDIRRVVLSAVHISKLNEATNKVVEINGYKTEFSSRYLNLYFEDQVSGSKWIVDYVTDLFNVDVRGLAIDRYSIWAFDWINTRQEKSLNRIGLLKPTNDDSNADELVDYVLKNARCSDLLAISEYVPDNYRFNGKLEPLKEVCFSPNGHWVTCDNLMNFDAMNIYIGYSRLTVSDLNPFLRHWRAGGSKRLEYLEVHFENGTVFNNFFDEDLEIVRTNEVGRYPTSYGVIMVIRSGYCVQRTDGIKALVKCDQQKFYMIVQHERATNWREELP